jgi:hypothetical protein
VTERTTIPHRRGGLIHFLTAAAGLLLLAGPARGQDALRMSLAGDLAAEMQHQANSTFGYYNLLWGPTAWRYSSGLGLSYDDNVRLESEHQQGDFILRPNLNTQMHWPVTQWNSLDLSVGAGYSAYMTQTDLNQFYMNPGSGLSFNIYAGDCVINLHDWISITEYSYQNPSSTNNGSASRLENAVGASALWDLNKVVTQLGYDHVNSISLGSSQQDPDATSDNWFANAGVRVLPEVMVGVEGGVGLISYNQGGAAPRQPDATQWNAGVFCKDQISEHINARLDAGYTIYSPAETSGFTNLSSSANMYFQLLVTHQVNQFIDYALSAGRITETSFYGQPYDRYSVRLQPNWKIFRKYTLSTPFWWEKGDQLASDIYGQGGANNYDQYGAGVNISHSLTQKLTGTLGYQYVKETSSDSGLNYTVSIVSLNFSYQF